MKYMLIMNTPRDGYTQYMNWPKKILEANPKAVKGFVNATAKGWRDAIANPAAAIAALKKSAPLADEKLETEKLQWLIKNQIVTTESKADGLGGVRAARMEKAVDTLVKAFQLPGKVTQADVFTADYLPAADVRKLP